ncbi:MAG: NIL domain-containing protein [Actinomycetota bacterium]
MTHERWHLTFPETRIQEPVIYNLGKQYDVVTNIRRANVEERFGWVILEVEGSDEALQNGMDYLSGLGVTVDRIEGDVVQG